MKPTRVLTGALVVGSVAVAAMFAASPAVAATLPPGQKITVIDQWGDQFYNVNPTTAVSTPVGTPTGIEEYESGVDVDDTGLGYAVATYWEYESDLELKAVPEEEPEGDVEALAFRGYPWSPDGASIYKADANTGALSDEKSVIIDVPGEKDPLAADCTAIDYSNGVIVAVCYTYFDGYDEGYIGTVDVTSDPEYAILTPLVMPEYNRLLYITAIALNPITGVYWAFDSNYGEVYTFTLDDEYVEYVDEVDYFGVLGADFDRSGQLWLSVAEYPEAPSILALNPSWMQLATFDFAASAVVPVAPFASEDPYQIDTPEALTVWGVLAATGSTMSIAPAVAASGVLLLGAILAAGTMVLRRRNADV